MNTTENNSEKVIVLGISGCSCSGKTTLAQVLQNFLSKAVVIHQDDYYKLDRLIPKDPGTGYDNWDTPQAIDMDQFYAAVKNAKDNYDPKDQSDSSNKEIKEAAHFVKEQLDSASLDLLQGSKINSHKKYRYVIVEGFLYLHEPRFLSLLSGAVLAWADYPTLLERREARPGYETKEGFWADPPNYFEMVVWPSFLNYYEPFIAASAPTPSIPIATLSLGQEDIKPVNPNPISPNPPNQIRQLGLDWANKYRIVYTDTSITLGQSALEVTRHLLTYIHD